MPRWVESLDWAGEAEAGSFRLLCPAFEFELPRGSLSWFAWAAGPVPFRFSSVVLGFSGINPYSSQISRKRCLSPSLLQNTRTA